MRAPQGSMETMRSGSAHCGCGPIRSVGAVLVRSARWPRSSAPAATASARYTPYEPECAPITLRWLRLVVLPTTGPRSAGSPAPQCNAGAPVAPWPGCDVSRMWRDGLDEGSSAMDGSWCVASSIARNHRQGNAGPPQVSLTPPGGRSGVAVSSGPYLREFGTGGPAATLPGHEG